MASSSKPPAPKKEAGTESTDEHALSIKVGNFVCPEKEEDALSRASHLTREEVLRRRLHHVKRLSRVYRDYFWALMEDLRVQYREYYWKYGISPYKEEEDDREIAAAPGDHDMPDVEGTGETNTNTFFGANNNPAAPAFAPKLGFAEAAAGGLESKLGGNNRCTFVGCKLKAMALTSFCHLHILSDPHQKLYKACNYVIKSAQAGPILCGKPILRSTVPSLCNVHFQKAQKHVARALKKAGLNSSSSKLAPKFHVIVAEYVRDIQARRRISKNPSTNIVVKEECGS